MRTATRYSTDWSLVVDSNLTIGNPCKVRWSQISDDLLHYPESLQHTLFALQVEPLKIYSESSSLLLS